MKKAAREMIYSLFADLLDYPRPITLNQARECTKLLSLETQNACDHLMRPFEQFMETTPLSRLEEIYTATFDVNPASYIYAGYLLFGESFKRGKFLVRLQEKYRQHDFPLEKELADHIPTIFRFLAILDPKDILAQQLVKDCLIPSLKLMTESFGDDPQESNPYARLLDAALIVLNDEQISFSDTKARLVAQPMRGGD